MEQEYKEPPWSARIAVAVAVSALCGMFALPAKASMDDFWTIQLYAQCIGLAVLACNTLLVALVVRRMAASSGFLRLIALILSLPVGYEIGTAVAAFLHGDTVAFGAVLRMPRQIMLIMVTSAIAVILLFGSHWRIMQSTAARLDAQRLATEVQLRLLQAQLARHPHEKLPAVARCLLRLARVPRALLSLRAHSGHLRVGIIRYHAI